MVNNIVNKTNPDEIDLIEVYNVLKNGKYIIILFSSIFSLIAIFYSILATTYYSAYVSIYPMGDESRVNSSMGQIEGLASTFGINIGGGGVTSFYIPDVVASRKLRKSIVQTNWETESFTTPVNLISFWVIDDTTGFSVKRLISSIFPAARNINPEIKNAETAMEKLEEQISVDEEESGLIIISVLMEEPQLAADIANYIADYVKFYISEEMTLQSEKYRIFIEDRMDESKLELSNIEEMLTQFRIDHPLALDTPDLQLTRARLIRDVEINQEVYLTLLTQYELAKIEELKETPVINILDNAEAPVEKYKPNRKLLVSLGLFSGLFIGGTIVLFKHYGLNQGQTS